MPQIYISRLELFSFFFGSMRKKDKTSTLTTKLHQITTKLKYYKTYFTLYLIHCKLSFSAFKMVTINLQSSHIEIWLAFKWSIYSAAALRSNRELNSVWAWESDKMLQHFWMYKSTFKRTTRCATCTILKSTSTLECNKFIFGLSRLGKAKERFSFFFMRWLV